ncbi:MAG TPA: hypothetical protein VIH36_03430, partial [Casimicrobiaceae bacterium]
MARVREARRADWLRAAGVRRCAAAVACRDKAVFEAAARPSRRSADSVARARFADGARPSC